MRKNPLPYLFAILVIFGMVGAASFGQIKTIEYGVRLDAERKALQWSGYLAGAIPDVAQLLSTGAPTPEQAARIDEAVHYGDVFGFKLFDNTGRNILLTSRAWTPSSQLIYPTGPSPRMF